MVQEISLPPTQEPRMSSKLMTTQQKISLRNAWAKRNQNGAADKPQRHSAAKPQPKERKRDRRVVKLAL